MAPYPEALPREVLIDHIVTRGSTLVAAASRLRDVYPDARIRAFALMRYRGLVEDLDTMCDPCVGKIRWDGIQTFREP